ncbi:hypothetical protein GDO86_011424 [Hymenochirus boettgeri]|uniref:Uncharacterized protein n=1 Tax=Hymenochirus boettgeri TaxID=247094 RepID=A0A8T2JJ41_9PIPI|nr:hypothetical protein GDO86_011424 [Hymenochirus boettgeri]
MWSLLLCLLGLERNKRSDPLRALRQPESPKGNQASINQTVTYIFDMAKISSRSIKYKPLCDRFYIVGM